ncbi:hypothetical protein [Rhizobium sp. AAP43]|uniref:hypothetical protein n=1 Tax=Rhizobium sp. AAP43 TaxID=1523420 RepID=UPI0006B91D5F|nr:hypothetical protein [Rhizobium sp. AAP43]KPF47086.1 hypothetical protein IP76_01960 [Rhizobium sp. AAP43]
MTLVPYDLHRPLDPARMIERAALPNVGGADLMAMADIEKMTALKTDWRKCRGIEVRDFNGTIQISRKGKA